ncbi:hypothetical protein KH5_00050 [Urechidicola sp. KH5]
MKAKNLLLASAFVLFAVGVFANNNMSKTTIGIANNAVITDVETSLSFFVPTEHKEVFIFVSDENNRVFQKVKVYQRGNGKIFCDKTGLKPGIYYYTLVIDGKKADQQKLQVK